MQMVRKKGKKSHRSLIIVRSAVLQSTSLSSGRPSLLSSGPLGPSQCGNCGGSLSCSQQRSAQNPGEVPQTPPLPGVPAQEVDLRRQGWSWSRHETHLLHLQRNRSWGRSDTGSRVTLSLNSCASSQIPACPQEEY